MGDAQMGLQARLMSQALRKLTGIISKSKTSMIFINQLRQKIGMFVGNPETTTGGNALKFYASVRLDVRRISQIKDGDEVIGSRIRAKVVKNKVAPPFRQAEFDMMYGVGISHEGDLLDLASERGLVQKSGAWYSYQEDRIGQGRENAKKYLKEHRDVALALEQQLRQTLGLMRVAAELPAGTEPGDGLWDHETPNAP
jgi:recombination protein RecA